MRGPGSFDGRRTYLALLSFNPIAKVRVRASCHYAASKNWTGPKFTPQDHKGRFVVNAIKGDPSKLGNQYQILKLGPGGSPIRIDKSNFELLATAWTQIAADQIKAADLGDKIVVAPLPSSKATPEIADYRTRHLAEQVVVALGGSAVLWDGVRFKQQRTPVHGGGDRSTIYSDMVLISEPPTGQIVVLDDVYTQGDHLNALLRHLDADRRPEFMVCCGKTIWDTPPKEFPDEFEHSFFG